MSTKKKRVHKKKSKLRSKMVRWYYFSYHFLYVFVLMLAVVTSGAMIIKKSYFTGLFWYCIGGGLFMLLFHFQNSNIKKKKPDKKPVKIAKKVFSVGFIVVLLLCANSLLSFWVKEMSTNHLYMRDDMSKIGDYGLLPHWIAYTDNTITIWGNYTQYKSLNLKPEIMYDDDLSIEEILAIKKVLNHTKPMFLMGQATITFTNNITKYRKQVSGYNVNDAHLVVNINRCVIHINMTSYEVTQTCTLDERYFRETFCHEMLHSFFSFDDEEYLVDWLDDYLPCFDDVNITYPELMLMQNKNDIMEN